MSRKVRVSMGKSYRPAFVRCRTCIALGIHPDLAVIGCGVCREHLRRALWYRAMQSGRRSA